MTESIRSPLLFQLMTLNAPMGVNLNVSDQSGDDAHGRARGWGHMAATPGSQRTIWHCP